MSSSSEGGPAEEVAQVIYEASVVESSVDPPMEEWSSLIFEIPEENKKKILYAEGLYDPGSGEICTKYISQSASSVINHPYYKYPAIIDPGIQKALLLPEDKVIYPNDGQELYMAMCKQMGICPVRSFHRELLEEVINLRYYCVNPVGVRAMAMALRYNMTVRVLDLTENFLSQDACFHLGEMLMENSCLYELNLTGCRIGAPGLRRICVALPVNRGLKKLILDKNQLGDEGGEILAQTIFQGLDVKELSLSYNNIGPDTAKAFADAFETHNNFTHLDLSWNSLFPPGPTYACLDRLAENLDLQVLNLSWNSLTGPKIGTAIKKILACPHITHIDLSNNKLSGPAIINLAKNLSKAKKLITLNLSNNPLTQADALKLIETMKETAVKMQRLLLDNVIVSPEFVEVYHKMMEMRSKKKNIVTWGEVATKFESVGVDARVLLLKRADFIAKKHKKAHLDIALWCMAKLKEGTDVMTGKDFMYYLKKDGVIFDEDLTNHLVETFLAYKTAKAKFMSMSTLVDFMVRMWPDRKLPPTPPPEPEPMPVSKKDKNKKKK